MFSSNLFERILLEPAKRGADKLCIVSGYATPAMAYQHLRSVSPEVYIELIVGMTSTEGISRSNHIAFKRLAVEDYRCRFKCRYKTGDICVHSKSYTWLKGNKPFGAYCGSANYTKTGFGQLQEEAMAEHDPRKGLRYFKTVLEDTVDCIDSDVEKQINFFDISPKRMRRRNRETAPREGIHTLKTAQGKLPLTQLKHVPVSLLTRTGTVGTRSGLNWGQRTGREQNQAYIPLKANVYHSDFFPPVGEYFTIHTDDNRSFVCVRAQDNGKAIHTPENNSLWGLYFRKRIGLESGKFVNIEDLKKYGRTDASIYKIDNENYFLDFSV